MKKNDQQLQEGGGEGEGHPHPYVYVHYSRL